MAEGKYCKIGGLIKTITAEYTKIDGVIKEGTTNVIKVGGAIKEIPVAAKMIFACERESGRFYAINSEHDVITGWPVYSGEIRYPEDVACDADNYSYWGCAADYYYVRKLGPDGTIIWTYTGHTSPIHAICVDADGSVYSGDSAGTVKKIDSDGNLVWSKQPFSGDVYALAVDYSAGKLYAVLDTGLGQRMFYWWHTSTGGGVATYLSPTAGDQLYSIAIDDTPYLYVGDAAGRLGKIGLDGHTYWNVEKDGEIHVVRVGHDGYGYFVNGTKGGVGKFVLSTGANVWYHESGGEARDVAVDKAGRVYSTHGCSGSVNAVIRKWSSAGVEQWTWRPYEDSEWMGVAVSPGIKAAGF